MGAISKIRQMADLGIPVYYTVSFLGTRYIIDVAKLEKDRTVEVLVPGAKQGELVNIAQIRVPLAVNLAKDVMPFRYFLARQIRILANYLKFSHELHNTSQIKVNVETTTPSKLESLPLCQERDKRKLRFKDQQPEHAESERKAARKSRK